MGVFNAHFVRKNDTHHSFVVHSRCFGSANPTPGGEVSPRREARAMGWSALGPCPRRFGSVDPTFEAWVWHELHGFEPSWPRTIR